MKYIKWFLVIIFVGLLILMKRFEIIFKTYGVTQNLDMTFNYTADEVYSTLGKLGRNGRNVLLQYYIIDYLFIISFGAIQILVLKLVLGERFLKTKLKHLTVIPYLRGALDFVENTVFICLVLKMPVEYPDIVPGLSLVTQAKLIVYGGWILSIVIIGILRFNLKLRDKNIETTV